MSLTVAPAGRCTPSSSDRHSRQTFLYNQRKASARDSGPRIIVKGGRMERGMHLQAMGAHKDALVRREGANAVPTPGSQLSGPIIHCLA